MPKSSKIIVTAALPYANGPIHIGHLLEYIQADIYSRFLRSQGKDVLYICASDMHGTPIEINAQKAGKKPEQFALEWWQQHQQDFAAYFIHFDEYYKTHSPENKELAELFYKKLKQQKLIYTKEIRQMYDETAARFLPDRYVKGTCPKCQSKDQYGDICEKCGATYNPTDLVNPLSVVTNTKPVLRQSTHYFFKLSSFSKKLQRWFDSKAADIQPEMKNWLKEWLAQGLQDWCISRDSPYFGFEIPHSTKETGAVKYFYVWLDAPIGYISATKHYTQQWKKYWQHGKVQHFIGKDIAYFHFLFWPALLMAVGFPLPQLTVHGFITVNGQKMSKSRGTFFTAKDFLAQYPPEALRFFYASHLDRKLPDVDVNLPEFQAFNNNVLAANIGNFCYRVLTFAHKNYGTITKIAAEKSRTTQILSSCKKIEKYYLQQDFKNAVKEILSLADLGNAYFQQLEPWKEAEKKAAEVGWCVNIARNLAIMLQPILPEFTQKIAAVFGEKNYLWEDLHFQWRGKIHLPEMLIQKIESIEQKTFPLQMRVGQILAVRNHPNADSLYLFTVNFGNEQRQVVAGLKKYFSPDQLLHKKLLFCVNLKPATLRGEVSAAMTLIADDGTKLVLVETPHSLPGSEATFGIPHSSALITLDEFKANPLVVMQGKISWNGKTLATPQEVISLPGVQEGTKLG